MGRTGKEKDPQEAAPQMKERAREEIKERIFANPKTGEEAEPDLPSLEHLANGYNAISLSDGGEYKIMTKEQILTSGTLLQKLRLYISSIDLSGYFEATEQLTEEEESQIRASIQTNKDRELATLCVKEYNTIFDFGKRLSYFFKRFQTSYAVLAVLLNKWEGYEYTAKQLTLLYSLMKTSIIAVWEEEEEIINGEIYPEETRQNFIQDLLYSNVLDGATLKFNKETENFYIDVEEKGGLYSQIQEAAKDTTKALSDFKAYVIVAEKYIYKSTLKFMPIPIQMSIENAEEERYTRYLVKNLRYFRSELNQRIARGETITPEDKRRAVIPDFYEVKPSKNVLADCKEVIKKISDGR